MTAAGGADSDGAGSRGIVEEKNAEGRDAHRGSGGADTDGAGTSGIVGGRDAGGPPSPPTPLRGPPD